MTTNPGEKEEAVYLAQVRRYRRRFRYTMLHDRRDLRAKRPSPPPPSPTQHEIAPSPDDRAAR